MTASQHVESLGRGYNLHFSAGDMKNRRPISFDVPLALVPFFRAYLLEHRPRLLDGNFNDALWITEQGNKLTQDGFAHGLRLVTKKLFGIAFGPHTFRHIAATSIAEADPVHVGIIRDILGHRTARAAEWHYNRATAVHSSRRMQWVLRNIRGRVT